MAISEQQQYANSYVVVAVAQLKKKEESENMEKAWRFAASTSRHGLIIGDIKYLIGLAVADKTIIASNWLKTFKIYRYHQARTNSSFNGTRRSSIYQFYDLR